MCFYSVLIQKDLTNFDFVKLVVHVIGQRSLQERTETHDDFVVCVGEEYKTKLVQDEVGKSQVASSGDRGQKGVLNQIG